MGQLKPDHKTIAEFRRKNKKALKKVLDQCARMCVKLGLIEGNTLFVDGSKIRANAAIKNTWTDKKCGEALKNIDTRIEEILKECDEADIKERDMPSLVKMNKGLSDSAALKSRVLDILKELKSFSIKIKSLDIQTSQEQPRQRMTFHLKFKKFDLVRFPVKVSERIGQMAGVQDTHWHA